jgi:hypothetical protein
VVVYALRSAENCVTILRGEASEMVRKLIKMSCYGGGKSIEQLETIWYEIGRPLRRQEEQVEKRSCGQRHRNVIGCSEAGGRKEEAGSVNGEKKQLDGWRWRMASTPPTTKE